ncbi:hypothetical protein ACSS6W_004265 [Trichoderma asperelloides]
MTEVIPTPSGYPILGNVLDIDPEHPHDTQELFDEKRFQKSVSGSLQQVRNALHDGLFTAYPGEHNWEIAHRTLMPAFGPLSIGGMFSEMQDIISQMVVKWARFGPDTPIDVPDDFTRLTLDSIALCAMGTRFNSFYHESQHPFVRAMVGVLTESFIRSRRPPLTNVLFQTQEKQYREDIEELETVAKQLLNDRRTNPTSKKDLLNAMILNKDPKTGESLDDDTIIRNMITFLIAGHETTAGLLSFLFYELLQNPEAYRKAQEEVDTVIGSFLDHVTVGPTSQLAKASETSSKPNQTHSQSNLPPLLVLFGSNTGTCEALAQSLASSAEEHGFAAQVKSLDTVTGDLPQEVPVVIITASYEGQPPDNAAHFVEWLTAANNPEVKNVRYAVFGVGNKEWRSTYQKVPTVIDDALANNGGKRITNRAAADVTQGNIFDVFDDWQDQKFWPQLSDASGNTSGSQEPGTKELKIQVNVKARSSLLRQDVQTGEVTEARLLTKPGAPRKRHIGIRLPTGLTYRAGDYLAVLPLNPPEVVRRVMKRFGLPWDTTITIDQMTTTSLPTGKPLVLYDVLASMVELGQPVTARSVSALAKSIPELNLKDELERRAAEEDFQKLNVTLLDVLEDYPSATFSLGQFLAAIPPMRMRQYSISSTPLDRQSECSLTYTVIDAPSKGSRQGHRFFGVASSYLERLSVGDQLHISLRPSRTGFHLPTDDRTPIIMACAGTGLAPFHAFIAERAIKKAGGKEVGEALLFYGCNHPEEDDLYREEFDAWQQSGVVDVRRAYTFKPEASNGCKFVQDRIWFDRQDTARFFQQGAKIYICGAGIVGSGVEDAMARIRMETTGVEEEVARDWVQKLKGERFWADVFA